MYGTLFAALTFTISGTKIVPSEGSISLATQAPPGETKPPEVKQFTLRKANVAAAATTATEPTSTEKAIATPQQTPVAATADTKIEAPNSSKKIRVTNEKRKIGDTEYLFKYYQYEDGSEKSFVLYEPINGTEAKNCDGNCLQTYPVVNNETTLNISQLAEKIEKDILAANKTNKSDSTPKKENENKDEDSEEVELTKGERILEKINEKCDKSSKEASSQIECKVEKFIDALNKKLDKQKQKIEITEDEASDFFNEYIKDGLKEMLTHKFTMPIMYNNSIYETQDIAWELNKEKEDATKEKNKAVKLIKNLLKNIAAKYKDVRAETTKLHNEAVSEQAKEALLNYQNMKRAEKNKDILGQRSNFGSFVMNDEFLRSLDRDLYSGISSGLYDSRSLMENSFYNQVMRDLNNSHSGICISYSRALGQSTDGCGTTSGYSNNDLLNLPASSGAISNSLRSSGRGNVLGNMQSGSVNGGVRILTNGVPSTNSGSSPLRSSTNGRTTPLLRGNQ